MGIFYFIIMKIQKQILSDSINKAYIINQKRYNSTNYIICFN